MADHPVPAPPPPPVVCNACQEATAKPRKHCRHCEWWYPVPSLARQCEARCEAMLSEAGGVMSAGMHNYEPGGRP